MRRTAFAITREKIFFSWFICVKNAANTYWTDPTEQEFFFPLSSPALCSSQGFYERAVVRKHHTWVGDKNQVHVAEDMVSCLTHRWRACFLTRHWGRRNWLMNFQLSFLNYEHISLNMASPLKGCWISNQTVQAL